MASITLLFTLSFKSNIDDEVNNNISSEVIENTTSSDNISSEGDIIKPNISIENKPTYTKKTKVYINPSVQHANLYINGKGN